MWLLAWWPNSCLSLLHVQIDSYHKLEKLGEGTYATVYRGLSMYVTDSPLSMWSCNRRLGRLACPITSPQNIVA